jgi:hypothetical protein
MNRDKQIKEMAKDLIGEIKYDTVEHYYSEDSRWTDVEFDYTKIAENLIDKGYRKASDVVREIFNDIENAIFSSYYSDEIEDSMLTFTLKELDEVKHKHLNEDFFVKMTGFVEPIIPRTIESIADLAFPESEGEG